MYKPSVSEHAAYRYIERTARLDLEAIKREILSPAVVAACKAGANSIKVNGLTFILDRGVVITVLKGNWNGRGSAYTNGTQATA